MSILSGTVSVPVDLQRLLQLTDFHQFREEVSDFPGGSPVSGFGIRRTVGQGYGNGLRCGCAADDPVLCRTEVLRRGYCNQRNEKLIAEERIAEKKIAKKLHPYNRMHFLSSGKRLPAFP